MSRNSVEAVLIVMRGNTVINKQYVYFNQKVMAKAASLDQSSMNYVSARVELIMKDIYGKDWNGVYDYALTSIYSGSI